MFTIKAHFSDTVSINAGRETVLAFFQDLANYDQMMPGIDSITVNVDGSSKWVVAAEIPVVGAMRQEFFVRQEESSNERIEFGPAETTNGNLLRFFAEFGGAPGGPTELTFVQNVELRREKAKELHFLAGMAGEAVISSEMTKSVSKMIKTFIARSKAKLEE